MATRDSGQEKRRPDEKAIDGKEIPSSGKLLTLHNIKGIVFKWKTVYLNIFRANGFTNGLMP